MKHDYNGYTDEFPEGSASVLVVKNGDRVLAVSRRGSHADLGLPGGKIEPGESPISAACREAVEEIGAPICNPRLLHVAGVKGVNVFVFSADTATEIRDHVNSENARVCWATPSQICTGTFGHFNKKHILPLL